jgi:hypothetical protein
MGLIILLMFLLVMIAVMSAGVLRRRREHHRAELAKALRYERWKAQQAAHSECVSQPLRFRRPSTHRALTFATALRHPRRLAARAASPDATGSHGPHAVPCPCGQPARPGDMNMCRVCTDSNPVPFAIAISRRCLRRTNPRPGMQSLVRDATAESRGAR